MFNDLPGMGDQKLVTDQVLYAESPRWRQGRLFFSDVHDYKVKCVDLDGNITVLADVPNRPAGIGFMPDGQLVVATAFDRCIWTVTAGRLNLLADLSTLSSGLLNDMVVDGNGRAYVGATGFNLMAGESPKPGQVIKVEMKEPPVVVADDVMFPNGIAVSAAGDRLFLAETAAHRVSTFGIAQDGTLTDRRLFVQLDTEPDGLCLDGDDGVWVALLRGSEFIRFDADARQTHAIDAEGRLAVACVLGGENRLHLFLCSADTTMERLARGVSSGRIHVTVASAPGAGWP
ncbi:SMP-30/gluconolactonase/LRE family protein [Streptomyces fulvoviolaceus]|uniref:SMP-30/gluconolactonase/LRE family protein n=1 Tax=Streptomyces fulvoviolaceus TaxID=285535 RepID=UPI0004C69F9A|nr:SMP-30/gluconolactonase/LRE family protein [Streptomyces fulvoviolaceus]